jgi:O-antigen/teichoic acid export membrane protein
MIAQLRRFLPQGRFARRLTILSGGTALGQGALVLVSPLLTRLYGPEEFGVLAVFSAVAAIICPVTALRYEAALPVVRGDEDAAALAVAGCLAAAALSTLCALLLLLAGAPLATRLGIPGFGGVLWFLPPILLAWGLSLVLAHWSIRRGSFRVNAVSNLALSASQAVGQLVLGLVSATAAALVAGFTAGPLVRCGLLLRAPTAADRAQLRAVSWRRVVAVARVHWHYPAYSGSSALLQSAGQMLPAVFIAILYGPAAAGWFGLGQRVTGMPTRMVGEAVAQAYLSEIAQAEGPAVHRLFKRTALRCGLVGLVGLGPLLLAGPPLFALVFGEPWRETGAIVQLLVPLHLARFVVLPVAQTLNVTGRQHLHLVASLLGALALFASFALGAVLDLPLAGTLLLYSAGSTAAFLFHLACAWRAARAAAAAAAARPAGEPEGRAGTATGGATRAPIGNPGA